MARKLIGPTGSRRRRRLALLLPLAAIAALVLAIASSASNSTLVNFEIDGNLVATTTNGDTEDWLNSTGTGVNSASAALFCDGTPCTPADVKDGSGLGFAELFRDDLKVDPDHTTFTQGDKENDFTNVQTYDSGTGQLQSDTPWHIVTGSVPPNKDDLFDVVTNTYISGSDAELDLGMVRTNNNGSSHVDFELNQQDWTAGGGDGVACAKDTTGIDGFVCPKRTEGDLLVSFEISPSSTTPPVAVNTRYFVWDLPGGTDAGGHGRGDANCEGPLSGNEKTCPWEEIEPPANTSILLTASNADPLAAAPWGSRLPDGTPTATYPAGGWFEAAIDLDELGFSPSCPGFGTASAKARSSGSSVTSALTDLAGPFPVDLNTCANVTITKNAVPNSLQDFAFTTSGSGMSDFSLDDDSGVSGADDTLSNSTGTTFHGIAPGSKVVREYPIPTGWALTDITCGTVTGSGTSVIIDDAAGSNPDDSDFDPGDDRVQITLGNLGDVSCTFKNELQRSLIISKVAKDASTSTTGNEPLGGVTFAISPDPTGGTGDLSVTDLFADETSGTDQFRGSSDGTGLICVDVDPTVTATSYSITETVPSNYAVDGDNPKTGVTPTIGTCATRGTSATADAAFVNDPLSSIEVIFDSLATGASGDATAAQIVCSDADGAITDARTSENNSDDNSGGSGTDPVYDDSDETFSGLTAGTYTCQVIIDP